MLTKFPFITRLIIFVILPLGVALYCCIHYLTLSYPSYSGQMSLNGLKDKVEVTFDNFGVPKVVAKNDEDAYFVQGYLHASERLWQMELQKRMVQGRLSELYGIESVPVDIWMRTLGLRKASKNAWESLSEGAKSALIAYAKGVNEWLRINSKLPVELEILGISPEPWEPIDSLAWQKVLALNLGLNMYGEINRMDALQIVTPEELKNFTTGVMKAANITPEAIKKVIEGGEMKTWLPAEDFL